MEHTTTIDGSTATIALNGKLTVAAAPDFEAALKELPGDVTEVCLDLTDLDYVASAGLRVIVSASKRYNSAGGSVRLLHPNDEVMEVFDATGLVDILQIEN